VVGDSCAELLKTVYGKRNPGAWAFHSPEARFSTIDDIANQQTDSHKEFHAAVAVQSFINSSPRYVLSAVLNDFSASRAAARMTLLSLSSSNNFVDLNALRDSSLHCEDAWLELSSRLHDLGQVNHAVRWMNSVFCLLIACRLHLLSFSPTAESRPCCNEALRKAVKPTFSR
jgi:hypothetical protein